MSCIRINHPNGDYIEIEEYTVTTLKGMLKYINTDIRQNGFKVNTLQSYLIRHQEGCLLIWNIKEQ